MFRKFSASASRPVSPRPEAWVFGPRKDSTLPLRPLPPLHPARRPGTLRRLLQGLFRHPTAPTQKTLPQLTLPTCSLQDKSGVLVWKGKQPLDFFDPVIKDDGHVTLTTSIFHECAKQKAWATLAALIPQLPVGINSLELTDSTGHTWLHYAIPLILNTLETPGPLESETAKNLLAVITLASTSTETQAHKETLYAVVQSAKNPDRTLFQAALTAGQFALAAQTLAWHARPTGPPPSAHGDAAFCADDRGKSPSPTFAPAGGALLPAAPVTKLLADRTPLTILTLLTPLLTTRGIPDAHQQACIDALLGILVTPTTTLVTVCHELVVGLNTAYDVGKRNIVPLKKPLEGLCYLVRHLERNEDKRLDPDPGTGQTIWHEIFTLSTPLLVKFAQLCQENISPTFLGEKSVVSDGNGITPLHLMARDSSLLEKYQTCVLDTPTGRRLMLKTSEYGDCILGTLLSDAAIPTHDLRPLVRNILWEAVTEQIDSLQKASDKAIQDRATDVALHVTRALDDPCMGFATRPEPSFNGALGLYLVLSGDLPAQECIEGMIPKALWAHPLVADWMTCAVQQLEEFKFFPTFLNSSVLGIGLQRPLSQYQILGDGGHRQALQVGLTTAVTLAISLVPKLLHEEEPLRLQLVQAIEQIAGLENFRFETDDPSKKLTLLATELINKIDKHFRGATIHALPNGVSWEPGGASGQTFGALTHLYNLLVSVQDVCPTIKFVAQQVLGYIEVIGRFALPTDDARALTRTPAFPD